MNEKFSLKEISELIHSEMFTMVDETKKLSEQYNKFCQDGNLEEMNKIAQQISEIYENCEPVYKLVVGNYKASLHGLLEYIKFMENHLANVKDIKKENNGSTKI